ncbi:MAG: ParA family protein [Mariprofundales bacterium]
MKVLALYSLKGGVGKTTAAVNLAYLAAQSGARTLLWDLDPQGASSYYLRVEDKVKGGRKILHQTDLLEAAIRGTDWPLLDLLPADLSYRNLEIELDAGRKRHDPLAESIRHLRHDYDYLVLDCPPGISRLSESVFACANVVLVPTIPTVLAMRTLKRVIAFRKKHGLTKSRLRAFFSMVDQRKRMHKELMARIDQMQPLMFDVRVPQLSEVELMGEYRAPLHTYRPGGRAAVEFDALWSKLVALFYPQEGEG